MGLSKLRLACRVLDYSFVDTCTTPPSGKRILLVEDQGPVREVLRELLLCDDHEVVEANNGAEALGLYARDQFDVVLTDCVMPFVSGPELAAQIKRLDPNQPVLMITGYEIRTGRANPVDGILHKPFDLARLRSALSSVCSSPAVAMPV